MGQLTVQLGIWRRQESRNRSQASGPRGGNDNKRSHLGVFCGGSSRGQVDVAGRTRRFGARAGASFRWWKCPLKIPYP